MPKAERAKLKKNLEHIILQWSSETSGEQRDQLAPDAHTLLDRIANYIEKRDAVVLASELTACLSQVPMPKLSYEQVKSRIAEIERGAGEKGSDHAEG